MRHTLICIFAAALSLAVLTGCQGSNGGNMRRARLIANENIQLKKQLEEKDRQIEDLQQQIADLEAEREQTHEEFGKTTIATLQIVSDTENRNQELTVENEKLKQELENLKAR